MEKGKKIIYTDSAKSRYEKLNSEIREKIEEYIRSNKNVPGDEFIEVTASDLDDLSNRIRIIQTNKTPFKFMIVIFYGIAGIVMTTAGLVYDSFEELFLKNPERLMFIAMGIILTSFSASYYYVLRQRELREKEYLYKDSYRKYLIERDMLIDKIESQDDYEDGKKSFPNKA